MRSVSENVRRLLRTAVLLLAVLALGYLDAAGNAVAAQPREPVHTQAGTQPLGAADIELLTKVRLAGLWEMPAGDWARMKAQNSRVQEVGQTIMVDHGRLDTMVRATAAQLGVPLPEQPNADQQFWLSEMQNATGAAFDQVFANRLRAAHGSIFPVIAKVRAGTRNDTMRAFATTANQAVLRHITLLESTGLVNYTSLPEAAASTSSAAGSSTSIDLQGTDMITMVVLALLLGGATVFVLWLIRNPASRRAARRSGGAQPETS